MWSDCGVIGIVCILVIVALTSVVTFFLARLVHRPRSGGGGGGGSPRPAEVAELRNSADVDDFVRNGGGVVLVHADWCPHCLKVKPAYYKLATSLPGTPFAVMNIDDAPPTFAKRHRVTGLPHIMRVAPDGTSTAYHGDRSLPSMRDFALS